MLRYVSSSFFYLTTIVSGNLLDDAEDFDRITLAYLKQQEKRKALQSRRPTAATV
jgi:hypothetical protein